MTGTEEPLRVKPAKINPFSQIWKAFKTMPKPFSRCLVAFTFSSTAVYQYQVAFSDFMGRNLFGGDNSDPAKQKDYENGVSWAMLCNCVNNGFQLVYGFFNARVTDIVGMKLLMIIANLFTAIGLLLFLFVKVPEAYLGIAAPLGFGYIVVNAIPYAIVSQCISTENLGANLGVLNCFCVFGQQISNFAIGKGVGAIFHEDSKYKIGLSSIFGFIATIGSFFIIQPDLSTIRDSYDPILDQTQSLASSIE